MKETNETLFQISKQMYNYINLCHLAMTNLLLIDWSIYWHIHEILLNSGFRDVSQDSDRAVIKKFYICNEFILFQNHFYIRLVPVGSSKKITITALFMSVFAWFYVLHMLLNSFKNDMIRNLICFVISIILPMFLWKYCCRLASISIYFVSIIVLKQEMMG